MRNPGLHDVFICPLCRIHFARQALDREPPELTLAHIIPEKLDGKACTLACAGCNNGNGTNLEAALVERFLLEDWASGDGCANVRMSGEFGNVGARFDRSSQGQGTALHIIAKQSHPGYVESLQKGLMSGQTKDLSFSLSGRFRHRPRQAEAAFFQSAYLMMFSHFGEDFAAHPHYAPMRERIVHPEEGTWTTKIIIPSPETSAEFVAQQERQALYFIADPAVIVVMMAMTPKRGRTRMLGVVLPGLDSPDIPAIPMSFKGAWVSPKAGGMSNVPDYLGFVWKSIRSEF